MNIGKRPLVIIGGVLAFCIICSMILVLIKPNAVPSKNRPVSTVSPTRKPSGAFSPTGLLSPAPAVPATATPHPTPSILPAYLIIPKLNINSAIEPVGMTATGNMDVPKNAADTAWYKDGTVPGMRGNAVMTGHYDTVTGKPAVFYKLYSLAIGDTVTVVMGSGERFTYIVTWKDEIDYKIFPSTYVFWTKPGINLNLITCGGIWDRNAKIYSKRIVVYTTLQGSQFNILPTNAK